MSLATKYRPKTWDDVTEQSTVIDILKSVFASDEITRRNFLFIGSAGIGKTTIARIIANDINDGKGEYIELDAASHNGVDDVREIVRQAQMYPVGCKWKVFILDEVHAFSNQAWQCLLKTIEEGPARSIFILCTTNPEKIPATILSRVVCFQLSKISLEGVTNRLKHILDCEKEEDSNIQYDEEAVEFIAKLANGGMRDGITLLDKALAYDKHICMKSVTQALSLPDYDRYFDLLNAFAKKNNESIIQIIHEVYNSGTNFIRWFEGFHSFVANIVKYIYMQDIKLTLIPSTYSDKISKYTPSHAVVCLKLSNRLLLMIKDLKSTQYLQETAITYLCSASKKE